MTDTNTEVQATEVNEQQEKIKTVAALIQEVLETNEMALQPFLSYTEFGLVPRVRLVDNKITTDDKGTNKDTDGEYQQADQSTGAVEPQNS
jgi:hypothetical protein